MADTTKIYENIFIKKNAAGDREYIKVPYAILADPPTIPDVSGFMPKSGGTFTGEVTFNKKINLGQGDANCLYLGSDGRLNGPENRTLFGLVSGSATFGHQAYSLRFRGSATRPQYTTDGSNYKDLALKSDIPDVSGKQDKLTAGSNITIYGNTISATVPTKTSQLTNDSNFVKSNSGAFTGNLTADNFNSRFSLQSVPYGTAVGENADLNTVTYLSVGNYYCGADAIVSTMTNVPVKRAFMMTVYSPLTPTVDNETTGKWVYRVRKFMTYLGEEYIQSVYSGSTPGEFTYGPWEKVAHTSDIPTVNNGSLIFHTALVNNYATFTANQSGSTVLTIDVDAINETNKEYSLAIGGVTRGARASGTYSVALGSNAQAKYTGTVKIGYGITPSSQSVTQINVGAYTSAGRALYLGAGRSGFTYMNAAGSSWTSASDIRDKTDIEEIDHALDFIKKLKPITYVMNDRERYLIRDEDDNPILDENGKQQYDIEAHKRGDKKKHRRFAGLSAQDTYQAMLDCYNNDTNYAQIVDNNKFDHPDDEYLEQYSMSYERLVPFLIKAVQEQQEQIEQLRSKLGE